MHPSLNRSDRRQRQETRRHIRARRDRKPQGSRRGGGDPALRPVEQILDQCEGGALLTDTKGIVQFVSAYGHRRDAAPAIQALIWRFETWERRNATALPLQPLRDLHTALHYLVPIQQRTVTGLQATLPILRRALALGSAADGEVLLLQAQINTVNEELHS